MVKVLRFAFICIIPFIYQTCLTYLYYFISLLVIAFYICHVFNYHSTIYISYVIYLLGMLFLYVIYLCRTQQCSSLIFMYTYFICVMKILRRPYQSITINRPERFQQIRLHSMITPIENNLIRRKLGIIEGIIELSTILLPPSSSINSLVTRAVPARCPQLLTCGDR